MPKPTVPSPPIVASTNRSPANPATRGVDTHVDDRRTVPESDDAAMQLVGDRQNPIGDDSNRVLADAEHVVGALSIWLCCVASVDRRPSGDRFSDRGFGCESERVTGVLDPWDHEVQHVGVVRDPIVECDDGPVPEAAE